MAKKNKRPALPGVQNSVSGPSSAPFLSKRGWKWVLSGLAIVVLGFIVLSFTDSMGQNTASCVSPFLVVGGYALIGLGLLQKDPA